MGWIDFRKAYDIVLSLWMITSLELVGAAQNIVNLLKESMKIWKTKLFYNNADLGRGKNKPWNVPRRLIATITILSPLVFMKQLKELVFKWLKNPCQGSSLNISLHFHLRFPMFDVVFLLFLWAFPVFPLVFLPASYFRYYDI